MTKRRGFFIHLDPLLMAIVKALSAEHGIGANLIVETALRDSLERFVRQQLLLLAEAQTNPRHEADAQKLYETAMRSITSLKSMHPSLPFTFPNAMVQPVPVLAVPLQPVTIPEEVTAS